MDAESSINKLGNSMSPVGANTIQRAVEITGIGNIKAPSLTKTNAIEYFLLLTKYSCAVL